MTSKVKNFKKESSNEERGVWSNKVDFFLSAIGYAGKLKFYLLR